MRRNEEVIGTGARCFQLYFRELAVKPEVIQPRF